MAVDKTILHLCADIGSDSEPYRKAGYNVICVGKDIDIRTFQPPPNVYGIIANPPCTMFSFARTKAKIPRDLRLGMELVKHCLRVIWECQYRVVSDNQKYSPLKFWVIENPKAMLCWFLGNPRLIYSPFEYGDNYQKLTCLWGNFNIPPKTPIVLSSEQKKLALTNSQPLPKFDKMLSKDISPSNFGKLDRTARRSICSPYFAKAFYEVNK